MKRIAILGSTGSIGHSTLQVIERHPDKLRLVGVAARTRIERLAEQTARFKPSFVAVWDEERAGAFAQLTGRLDVGVGLEGLMRVATHPDVDIVVIATSGREALLPLVQAIRAGKRIALASKELLVMAGGLIMRLVREHGTMLMPIDSEHAALSQCLQGVSMSDVRKLIITGSGGPLWSADAADHQMVTRERVLAHPKWRMGPKITVDSATLMNKGLEVIEARWLFNVPLDCFEIVIHPAAVVHAILELKDGTWLAQMSPCDMCLPIQYALSYPERWDTAPSQLRLTQLGSLQFFEPDPERFPCLRLALEAAAAGGSACVALNGANDIAVHAYLDGRAMLTDIPRIIEETLRHHTLIPDPTLEDVLTVDAWSRRTAFDLLQGSHAVSST